MAIESQDELKQMIAKQEQRLKDVQDQDDPARTELARIELEFKRLKNLRGDSGTHRQADVEMPNNTVPQNNPNSIAAPVNEDGVGITEELARGTKAVEQPEQHKEAKAAEKDGGTAAVKEATKKDAQKAD